jgi:hypothetical protein
MVSNYGWYSCVKHIYMNIESLNKNIIFLFFFIYELRSNNVKSSEI